MRHMTNLRFIDAVAREKSIRKAAEKLAITSTALNRRILQVEDEIGQPLFERLSSGVRLNTAGELFVQHVRSQIADLARVQSQISDLTGVRRGHVKIAGGADVLRFFLPELVANYRSEHNAVTFELLRQYGDAAEASLLSLDADLAFVFAPVRTTDFQVIATARQIVHCLMSASHPLAKKDVIRLRDCIDVPAILPTTKSGVRQLLDVGQMKRNISMNMIIESDSFEFMQNYLVHENAISFQIPISLEPSITSNDGGTAHNIVARPIDTDDVPAGILHIGQLKGRVLPVAAAKFLDNIIHMLGQRYPDDFDQ